MKILLSQDVKNVLSAVLRTLGVLEHGEELSYSVAREGRRIKLVAISMIAAAYPDDDDTDPGEKTAVMGDP